MVFINDPLTSGGHIRLLYVIITASALSWEQLKQITEAMKHILTFYILEKISGNISYNTLDIFNVHTLITN